MEISIELEREIKKGLSAFQVVNVQTGKV